VSAETPPAVSSTHYLRSQLAVLVAGVGALIVGHHVVRQLDGSGSGSAVMTKLLIVALMSSVALVGRAVYVIVTSAFSDAYRVFRSRHLLFCGAMLFAMAAAQTGAMVERGSFGTLFAYGRMTGQDIVDAATVLAALVCLFGAGVAFTGAWDRMQVERNWALYAGSRPGV
jgi:hypothetical protein